MAGKLYTWGWSDSGRLGNNKTSPSDLVPTQVGADTVWDSVSAGYGHTLAIYDGQLYAWGDNNSNQLGDGTTTDSLVPLLIDSDTDWTSVSSGYEFSLAIKAGQLYSWGSNGSGRTGQGTSSGNTTTPTLVGSDSDWQQISASKGGAFALAIKGGQLYAWGLATYGALGNGVTSGSYSTPQLIDSDTDWQMVSAGARHSLAIKGGKLFSWGAAANGRLGNGTTTPDISAPTQIGVDDWDMVSAGNGGSQDFSFALKGGSIFTCGYGSAKGLGVASNFSDTTTFTQVGVDTDWDYIAAGFDHTHGIKGGLLFGWGTDSYGQVGDAGSGTKNEPLEIDSSDKWTSVSAGRRYSAAIESVGGTTYPDEVLADSPYLYWRLGEAAGSATVEDSSTNDRDGDVYNNTGPGLGATSLIVNQPDNDAFECTGSGGAFPYYSDGDFSGIFAGGALTVEAWVRRSGTSASSGRIAAKESGFGFSWSGTTNQPRFNCIYNNTSGKILNATTTLNQDEDYHIVGVAYEESGTMYMDLYINGVLDASTTQAITTFGSSNTTSAFAVGARILNASSPSPSTYATNTFVDDVAIYPTALSPERIEDHYNAGMAASGAPPVNTVLPAISGTEKVGETLTTTDGTWTGSPTPTYTYQWQVSDDGSTGWSDISGATSNTYTLTSAQSGKYVRSEVTATNTEGTVIAESASSGQIVEDVANTAIPTVSGTTRVGETLTTTDGTWTGFPAPTYAYQWQVSDDGISSWSNISGATSSTYILTTSETGKYVRSAVTATNSENSVTAESASTTVINETPSISSLTISGTAEVGETLTANITATGFPTPTYTYQWEENDGSGWTNISGAVSSTYILTSAQAGNTIRVSATATNSEGSDSETSAATTEVIWEPANATLPEISYSGFLEVGNTLTASDGTWTGYPAPSVFTYQWEQSPNGNDTWTEIVGATNNTFLLTTNQTEKYIRVKVSTTTTSGSASAYSATTGFVSEDPVNISAPTVTGTTASGETLTADPGTWSGFPEPNFTYQWQSSITGSTEWTNISGATNSTLVLNNLAGKYIRVWVTATNPVGSASAASDATGPVVEAPIITDAFITGTEIEGETLTANATTTGYPEPTLTYQWQRSNDNVSWHNISGETASTLLLVGAETHRYIRVIITATNTEGSDVFTTDSVGPIEAYPIASIPVISGTPEPGNDLTTTADFETGYPEPTITILWQYSVNNGVTWQNTANTTTTYSLTTDDLGRLFRTQITATNYLGSDTETSAPYGPIVSLPVLVSSPTISGTEIVGNTLTATPGTYTAYPAETYAYQWEISDDGLTGWTSISGATSNTLSLTSFYSGKYLRISVTASNSEGSTTNASAATTQIREAPANTALPSISGVYAVNEVLTADPGTWTGFPTPTYTYQWQRNTGAGWSDISGATANEYLTTIDDELAILRVSVTATNSVESVELFTSATDAIQPAPTAPENVEQPTISGLAEIDATLTSDTGEWSGYPEPTISFVWERTKNTSGAWQSFSTDEEIVIDETLLGYYIRLKVTATNSEGTATESSEFIGPVFQRSYGLSTVLPTSNGRLLQVFAGESIGVEFDSEFNPNEAQELRWAGSADAWIKNKTKITRSGGMSDVYRETVVIIPKVVTIQEGDKLQIRHNSQTKLYEVLEIDFLDLDIALPNVYKCYIIEK